MSNEIATATSAKTSLTLSGPLVKALAEGSFADGVALVRDNPALRAEASSVVSSMRAICEPVGKGRCIEALRSLILIFSHVRVEAQAPDFWADYAEALQDLPPAALGSAVREWKRVGKFFPKPAELRELADPVALSMKAKLRRAERAIAEQPKGHLALPVAKVSKAEFDDLMSKLKGQTIA